MNRTFQARYTLTLEDYKKLSEAFRRLSTVRFVCRYIPVVLSIVFVAFAVTMWSSEWALAVYFCVLAVLLLALEYFAVPWQVRRQFAHQRLGEFEMDFRADEEGFSTHSELAEGRQKWPSIRRVDDLADHVILWPNNRMGWIVPKRAFESPSQAEAFASLAKEKTAGQKF